MRSTKPTHVSRRCRRAGRREGASHAPSRSLRRLVCRASIKLMSRSPTFSIRIATAVAGAVLLACQSVAIANACVPDGVDGSSGAARPACHKPAGNQPDDSCRGFCQTSISPSDPVKPPVFAATGFAALTVEDNLLPAADIAPAVFAARSEHAKPPPLIIVYCRLRN